MTFRSTVAAIVVLAAATVWAQSTPPATAPDGAFPGSLPAGGATRRWRSHSPTNTTSTAGNTAFRQRLQDMESTLGKMHALLKEMRAKTSASKSRDPLAKANLDMWELMLGDLDKQFEQLQATTLAREDVEARRAAMYKQAADKSDAAAQRAQALAASQATAVSGNQPAPGAGAGQAPPATPASSPAPPK